MAVLDEVRQRVIAAVVGGDAAAVAACYQPDAVVTAPEGRFEGREQIESYWRGQLEPFSERELKILSTHDGSDSGAGEWEYSATNTGPIPVPGADPLPPTGKRFVQRGVDITALAGDLIRDQRFYYDLLESFGQLGLAPAGGE